MARISTFPYTFEELITISIGSLKRRGFMAGLCWGPMAWYRKGWKDASIQARVQTLNREHEEDYMLLNYNFNGEHLNYSVVMVCAPSNLGNGLIWYFICPVTGRRCKKLYLNYVDGLFSSRFAQPGTFYDKQLWSKKYREIDNKLGRHLRSDSLYAETFPKFAKRHYQGKPTKRVLRYCRIMGEMPS